MVALRGGSDARPAAAADELVDPGDPDPADEDPSAAPGEPSAAPTGGPREPDPSAAATALDRSLKSERLWGTVQVLGTRVDIRSGACRDPGMAPVLDAALPSLRTAGLTKLRCLEQSGAVVFERDL